MKQNFLIRDMLYYKTYIIINKDNKKIRNNYFYISKEQM